MKNKNYLKISEYLLKLSKKAYKKFSKQEVEVNDKGHRDLLTNLDLSIEKYILKELGKNFPGVKIVSEEFNTEIKAEGTYFVIDPVDGTINFANGLNFLWGVQIAYIENDVTVASAIFLPASDSYSAARGFGAYKNGKRFFTIKKDPAHSLISVDCILSKNDCLLMSELDKDILKFRHFGACCIHAVLMAEGRIGGYVEYDGYPWDILPGFLIMEEAGCVRKTLFSHHAFASTEETLKLLVCAIEKFETKTSDKHLIKTKATLPQDFDK